MDGEGRIVRDGAIVIESDRIRAVGRDDEIVREWGKEFDEVIEARDKVALPGLIQSHVHLVQTAFRGLAEELELLDWLKERILPLEASLGPSETYYSSLLGCIELLKGGTTAVLDFGSVKHVDMVFKAMYDSGIRGITGKVLMDKGEGVPEGLIEDCGEAIKEGLKLRDKWVGRGRLGFAFSPRFALSCSERCLKEVAAVSREYGIRLHTHAAENVNEEREVERETGLTNIRYLAKVGVIGGDTVIAHCVWVDEEEVSLLAKTGTHVVHCPSTNLKLGSGVAKVPFMLNRGVNVAIGSDGAPCNNSLDVFWEMKLASLIHKGVNLNPKLMPAREVLKMATVNGAKALGLGDEIGSLEAGKKADLILVDLNKAHLSPFTEAQDPYSLIYSLRASDVSYTIVNGRVVVREGSIVTVREGEVIKVLNEYLPRVVEEASLR